MRALTVLPGVAGSGDVTNIPEPDPSEGRVLVETLAIGVCGTDREILAGEYGEAPPGSERLVLGHESIGRVLEAPDGVGVEPGDLVVGIVRRPDPVPCSNCAVGEWDMCRNGQYTEHGIKALHGFARQRYRADPEGLVRVDPALGDLGVLLEPTSVVAKAWEHIERIGSRAHWQPQRVLVTGAGAIGLLGALLGGTGRNAVVCLAGISAPGRKVALDLGALNREWVLENDAVFGTVNANRRHYEQAAHALAQADNDWLAGMLTRRVPLESYAEALETRKDDVKTVVAF
jgi:threonine dehydrogenase-like Zn-dependent dehydrogenase